ncbi:hypothetical protein Q4504_03000 [Mesomycoplasma ovipneumoniae]|nr:hypothetical protein [Mesomycoplasma ovipneumoniae]MDO6857423.1 hypothetical protein [Mesomycoplasma ovipneumoniae]
MNLKTKDLSLFLKFLTFIFIYLKIAILSVEFMFACKNVSSFPVSNKAN